MLEETVYLSYALVSHHVKHLDQGLGLLKWPQKIHKIKMKI